MLKQRKTFQGYGERERPKLNAYYGTKKSKFLQYILPAILIAFFLLLIMLNVHFDNEIYQIPSTNALLNADERAFIEIYAAPVINETLKNKREIVKNSEFRPIQASIPTWSDHLNNQHNLIKRFVSSPPNNFATVPVQECNSDAKNCTFSCTYGDNRFFPDSLNYLQEQCGNTDLSLTVNKFVFLKGILKKTFFDGQFSLKYLAINECNLQTIQDTAFTHANVKNLERLVLINNQLLMLQASTMAGLSNLKYFEFKQLPLQKEFKGKEFLKPLVNTVTRLIIQPYINSTFLTDPLQWWQNLILDSVLYLDLSNTNFQNILSANTFQSFPALETFILFNCNMQNFPSNTFDVVANTLKYLDLRFNHLKTLDAYFFYMMASENVKLNVELNDWFCKCDFRLFELLESYNAKLMEEIICSSPQEYYELDLKQLYVICQSIETTAITTEISSSTSATTPHITIPTTTTYVSTTVTTLDPTSTNPTTITTWETSPTTTTLEISTTTTTTLKPAPTISPTPEHTTTTSTTPTPEHATTTSTTPTPEHTTTTSQPITTETIRIICYKDIHKTDAFKTDIVKETLNFTVYTTSTTSVRIEVLFNEQRQGFTVLYFTNYKDSKSINGYTVSSEAVHITITNLQTSKVYLFCVIKDSSTDISPYDCQAQYLANMEPNAWLLQQDKSWFLTTTILSALIVFICTVFAVYCLLRRQPYWLRKGNERLSQVHNRPSLSTPPTSARTSNYLQPSVVKADISAENRLYISKHTVPLSKAPGSPPSTSRAIASETTLPPRNACLHGCKVNCVSRVSESFYQTIDHHYEELNF